MLHTLALLITPIPFHHVVKYIISILLEYKVRHRPNVEMVRGNPDCFLFSLETYKHFSINTSSPVLKYKNGFIAND